MYSFNQDDGNQKTFFGRVFEFGRYVRNNLFPRITMGIFAIFTGYALCVKSSLLIDTSKWSSLIILMTIFGYVLVNTWFFMDNDFKFYGPMLRYRLSNNPKQLKKNGKILLNVYMAFGVMALMISFFTISLDVSTVPFIKLSAFKIVVVNSFGILAPFIILIFLTALFTRYCTLLLFINEESEKDEAWLKIRDEVIVIIQEKSVDMRSMNDETVLLSLANVKDRVKQIEGIDLFDKELVDNITIMITNSLVLYRKKVLLNTLEEVKKKKEKLEKKQKKQLKESKE